MSPRPPRQTAETPEARRETLRRRLEARLVPPSDGPVSAQQERLWVAHHLDPEDPSQNLRSAISIRGPLESDLLQRCLQALVQRHRQLRTTFHDHAGKPEARLAPDGHLQFSRIDLRDRTDDVAIAETVRAEAGRPFDLAAGPLVRLSLLTLGEEDFLAVLAIHHIVCDAWSMEIILRDLGELYEAAVHDRPARLPDLATRYEAFAQAQLESRTPAADETSAAFWRSSLRGYRPTSSLPVDHPRPSQARMTSRSLPFEVPWLDDRALDSLAKASGGTAFMVLLSAFVALLHRLSGSTDVVVATPKANRDDERWEGVVGYFVNLLPLRIAIAANARFSDLVREVRRTVIEAHGHQRLPLHRIAEAADLRPATLVRVLYQHVATPSRRIETSQLVFEPRPIDLGTTRHDLSLTTFVRNDHLQGVLEYSADLFSNDTAERLLHDLEHGLRTVIDDAAMALSELPLTPRPARPTAAAPAMTWQDEETPASGPAAAEPLAGPNEIEAALIEIWMDILELDAVSRFDNFLDVGGDSLLALQVIERVERRLRIRLAPAELFTGTLAQVASICEAGHG